ncbi:hypothetical protein ABIE67_007904 [Streptomyces sp. V4I8]|uniref:hypothetical protein n=1 Tax=Streptomyces sp. V4I8 TaxID=3156469 RepID=UPI003518B9D8
MGYAYYEITRNGETIQAGYSVPTDCEEDGCEENIDRGLAHLCGETPGGDEHGCGGYYCGNHLYMAPGPGMRDLCRRCCDRAEANEKQPA